MASIANDKAMIHELMEGGKDLHSLTAYMSYMEIPRGTPIPEIKKKFHNLRQEAKGIEFAVNYGGNAKTISSNKGIPIKEAEKIYNNYMKGFSGLRAYQEERRKDWWKKGYIDLNPIAGYKAYIYDYNYLKEIETSTKEEGFWDYYREMKQSNPDSYTVQKIKKYYGRKSDSEKQSINYPIQHTGALCSMTASVNFFNWLKKNNLLFTVKFLVFPYDEFNIEAPEEIAEDIAEQLHYCMVKAGSFFCTRCKLDADLSRLSICIKDFIWEGQRIAKKGDYCHIGEDSFFNRTEEKRYNISVKGTKDYFDPNGPLPDFWIH